MLLLDIHLDGGGVKCAPGLSGGDDLRDELCVGDGFARLHDPNNGCLRFKSAVHHDLFMSLLVFFCGLLCLNLVDFNAVFGIRKIGVHAERVSMIDILAFRGLC